MSGHSEPASLEGITQDDLPILGENIAVDLANSDYGEGSNALDLIGPAWLASLWVQRMVTSYQIPIANDLSKADSFCISPAEHGRLLQLRDSARHVMQVSMGKGIPTGDAIGVLNAEAASAEIRTNFSWDSSGPRAEIIHHGEPLDVLCCRVALATMDLATMEIAAGGKRNRLKQCAGEGCTLLFVQQHGRRKFCHDSCSHRERQMRYRMSRKTKTIG